MITFKEKYKVVKALGHQYKTQNLVVGVVCEFDVQNKCLYVQDPEDQKVRKIIIRPNGPKNWRTWNDVVSAYQRCAESQGEVFMAALTRQTTDTAEAIAYLDKNKEGVQLFLQRRVLPPPATPSTSVPLPLLPSEDEFSATEYRKQNVFPSHDYHSSQLDQQKRKSILRSKSTPPEAEEGIHRGSATFRAPYSGARGPDNTAFSSGAMSDFVAHYTGKLPYTCTDPRPSTSQSYYQSSEKMIVPTRTSTPEREETFRSPSR